MIIYRPQLRSPRPYWEIPRFYGALTEETAERICDLVDEVLRHRFTWVDIVADMRRVQVVTGQEATVDSEGSIAVLRESDTGYRWLAFSAAHYSYGHALGGKTHVSWADHVLKISATAPAGHPVLFIFAPEPPREVI